MLPLEHSAILSTFIKLPFVCKIFALSSFEWPLKAGFTVYYPESKQQRYCAESLIYTFDVHMQQIRFSHNGLVYVYSKTCLKGHSWSILQYV